MLYYYFTLVQKPCDKQANEVFPVSDFEPIIFDFTTINQTSRTVGRHLVLHFSYRRTIFVDLCSPQAMLNADILLLLES